MGKPEFGVEWSYAMSYRFDADGLEFREDADFVYARIAAAEPDAKVRASDVRFEVKSARQLLVQVKGETVLAGKLKGLVSQSLWMLDMDDGTGSLMIELELEKQEKGQQCMWSKLFEENHVPGVRDVNVPEEVRKREVEAKKRAKASASAAASGGADSTSGAQAGGMSLRKIISQLLLNGLLLLAVWWWLGGRR